MQKNHFFTLVVIVILFSSCASNYSLLNINCEPKQISISGKLVDVNIIHWLQNIGMINIKQKQNMQLKN